jgi:phenylalanyl-tRNA synthetase alpha chain
MSFQSNITDSIKSKMKWNLHNTPDHPICIVKELIYSVFDNNFKKYDDLDPVVSTENNFDRLLIPKDHPARSLSDTYYNDEKTVLRTHTSAHQNEILSKGVTSFLATGDVYRKDEANRTHYPVFHQMEGLCIVDGDPKEELLKMLKKVVNVLFPDCEYEIKDDYFPFTDPSFEINVKYEGEWLEILGSGVVQPKILENCGYEDKKAWAFGIGLERIAMILFKIPDIRYFWSQDEKFLDQFEKDKITEFKQFSKLDSLDKDILFWIPEDRVSDGIWIDFNDFCQLCRDEAKDLIENVTVFDSFVHPKTKRLSYACKLKYSPNSSRLKDPAQFNKIVNDIQLQIRHVVKKELSLELR